ncbi:MAG: EAL domain-containing protein, partial [Thiomonas sp.]
GDEFIVVGHLKQQQHCDDLMRRILDNLAQPYALHEISLPGLTASIGVVRYPEVRCDADTLLRHADQTMYQAKRAGRNRWVVLDARQIINEESRQHLAQELRHALEAGQLCLYYQPKVHLGSGEVFAAEALLRWRHPTRGVLEPGDFLFAFDGSVEDEVALSRWVIEENLRQIDA